MTETETFRCSCGCPDGGGQHLCGCEVYDTGRMQYLRELVRHRRSELAAAIQSIAPQDVVSGEIFAAAVIYAEACAEASAEDAMNPNGGHCPIVE